MQSTQTRLFFVVSNAEENEQIFETLEDAEEAFFDLPNLSDDARPKLSICIVKNAYKDDGGFWNYEDLSDTFKEVKVLNS